MAKKEEIAVDAIGQEIHLDAIVAAPYTASRLLIGKVVKVRPKTVKIIRIDGGTARHTWRSEWQKSHSEIVVISDNPQLTLYVLKNSGE